jgi:hypothetical protein
MSIAMPLTTSAKKLRVWIQWVIRTKAECRAESKTSELWTASSSTYAESAMQGSKIAQVGFVRDQFAFLRERFDLLNRSAHGAPALISLTDIR